MTVSPTAMRAGEAAHSKHELLEADLACATAQTTASISYGPTPATASSSSSSSSSSWCLGPSRQRRGGRRGGSSSPSPFTSYELKVCLSCDGVGLLLRPRGPGEADGDCALRRIGIAEGFGGRGSVCGTHQPRYYYGSCSAPLLLRCMENSPSSPTVCDSGVNF